MGGKLGIETILCTLLPHPLPAPFIHARVTDHTKQEVPTLDLPSGSSSCPRISLNSNVFRQHPGCKKRLYIPSVSHIHTHSDSALAVLAVDCALGVLSCILSLLCPFFQSLYLTSLALKGISQVRAPASARSLRLHQRFWPGVWEWTSGSLWASFETACGGGIWAHVCFFFSQLQVGSQSRYETTAPESWRTTATGTK